LTQSIARKSIDKEIEDTYDSKSRAKPRGGRSAVLHRQSLLWAPLARKALNVAIIRSDGLLAKDENEKAAELASFWGKTFEEKLIDTVDAKAFLNEFAADFNFQKLRPPDQNVIEGFLAHARHSAPGPVRGERQGVQVPECCFGFNPK
jgi:hypothetical protein